MYLELPNKASRNNDGDYDDNTKSRFETAKRWRLQARIAQADNRAEMATDEDYYDTIQLEPQDIAIMLGRDQPPLQFNIIKHVTNWILGLEQRARIDYSILPRREKQAAAAKAKTNYVKYINDVSKGEFERSRAFAEAAIAGVGWLETGVRTTDEPFFVRAEAWRNMWFDHLSTASDYRDMRYCWREKWTDLDVAQAMFPEFEKELEVVCDSVNSLYPWRAEDAPIIDVASEFDLEDGFAYYGTNGDVRERVKLIEFQYRIPAKVQLMKMRDDDTPFGALHGSIYRKGNEDHDYLVKGKYFTLSDAIIMTIRNMMWTADLLFYDNITPYNHGRFSFTPIFCYRRKRDNMPYGVIRDWRDPQSDYNRRKSKMLFLLSANQNVLEENATNSPEKFHEEMQRPDGQPMVKESKLGAFKHIDHTQQISQHQEIAVDDKRFIYDTGGVTADAEWQKKNDLSGVAMDKLSNQSTQSHAILFRNYWQGLQLCGEILLANIEQFGEQEREIRVIGEQQAANFMTVNQRKEDGSIDNAITQQKADFIISKQDYRDTIRKAAVDQFIEMLTMIAQSVPKGGQVALAVLDIVVSFMDDLPEKDEIVARIRKITGQVAPEDTLTPEEQAKADQISQKREQEEQMLKQLELLTKQVEIQNEQAKANKADAEAASKKIDSFLKALEAAQVLSGAPHMAQAADILIAEAEHAVGGNGHK